MKKFIVFLLTALLFYVAIPRPEFASVWPVVVCSVIAAALMIYGRKKADIPGLHRADVTPEVWIKYIVERFYKDNQFLQHSIDDSQYVLAGKVIHVPQKGAVPTIVKNRGSYPATAVRRTDTDITYALDVYTSDPTHIPFIEEAEVSYDKMNDVLGDHMEGITETVADDILTKWAPAAAAFIRTTGSAVSPITGQTGNRKGFHHTDLKKAMIKLNTTKAPKGDRFALLDDNMFEYFYDSLGENNSRDFSKYVDAENGIIGRLHGFNILTRSSVLAYNGSDVVKALGSSLAAGDNLSCLCWQKNCVARAIGDKELFQDKRNPLYYGDIHSVLMRAGGHKRRSDAIGVVAIVQDAAS